jgi:hypothetical protein
MDTTIEAQLSEITQFVLGQPPAGAGRCRGRVRAPPVLAGRVVIGFEVIRTKGSHRFLRHRDDPSRQTVVPVYRNDLPPERFVRYCARPASAGSSFSIFFEQLPRHFVEAVRRLSDASCAARSTTPSQPSPIKAPRGRGPQVFSISHPLPFTVRLWDGRSNRSRLRCAVRR